MAKLTTGFDLSEHSFDQLALGIVSGILVMDEDIDIVVKDSTQPDGTVKRRIDTIGDIGPARASQEELDQILDEEKKEKLKAAAGKYKVRAKKPKATDSVPF